MTAFRTESLLWRRIMGTYSEERDPLTGLLTMMGFFNAVHGRKEKGFDMAYRINGRIIYFNLTDFKYYNASYGVEKGNEILRSLAGILSEEFMGYDIARFSDDHFVLFTSMVDVRERIVRVNDRLSVLTENGGFHLKAGIRNCPEDAMGNNALSILCDQAKIACDSIKYDVGQVYCVYSEELDRNIAMRSYITEHIRDAVREGHIHIFYQPIIRTMTGKLCGFEALARWIDPKFGVISPTTFVPILEHAHMVDILDMFVIDEVARKIKNQLNSGQNAVPISFNLSRVDFVTAKPFELVDEAVNKYGIPREYLRIEITESTLIEDPERVRTSIDLFHDNGFQVCMDDFGSGYSSLSMLHNYHFDEIKIDLMFLRNFTSEAKSIVTSVIDTAKRLGIHTLAEGVENAEQFEFLRSVGCEKIQGYYYGKPQELEETLQHCENYGMEMETPMESHVFDEAGKFNVLTDAPVILIYQNGPEVTPLYATESYFKIVRPGGFDTLSQLKDDISLDPYGTAERVRVVAQRALENGTVEEMSFARNGRYFRIRLEVLAGNRDISIQKIMMTDITMDTDDEEMIKFDRVLRNSISLFAQVYIMNFEKDEMHVLTSAGIWDKPGEIIAGLDEHAGEFADKGVFPEDRRRFLEFIDWRTMSERISESKKGFLINSFRVRQPDGNYAWRDFTAQLLSARELGDVVIFVRESVLETIRDLGIAGMVSENAGDGMILDSDGEEFCTSAELWSSYVNNSDLRYFWKDKNRRFVGVSKAFLDAFGLESDKTLIGKTDEDMHWHIDDEPFADAEEKVIDRGLTFSNQIGQCLLRGRNHTISSTKFPIYHNGKIAGLMGYFVDTEEVEKQHRAWNKLHMIDPVTGFMNERGTFEAVFRYYGNYLKNGQDFICAIVKVPEFEPLLRAYGQEVGDELLKRIAQCFKKQFSYGIAISSMGGGRFVLVDKNNDLSEVRNRVQEVQNDIHRIHEVRGYSCTMFAHYALAQASETRDIADLQQLLSVRLKEAIESETNLELFVGDRVQFDREKYDLSQERVYMADPKTYDLIYINKAALRDLGYPENYDYRSKKCYEVRRRINAPCENCTNQVLRRDRFYTWQFHNNETGVDYLMRETLVPWRGRNVRFTGGTEITSLLKNVGENRSLIHREVGVNDAITVALREEDPDMGILSILERIVHEVGAAHAFVFEENADGSALRTYHWPGSDSAWLLTPEEMNTFSETFSANRIARIRDREEIREIRFHAYSRLAKREIENYVIVEISNQGVRTGFFGVDNVPLDKQDEAEVLLCTLARFIAILIRNRDMMKNYNELSRRDSLTGTLNRRAFIEMLERTEVNGKTAIIYGDINGLKETNDQHGHDAGDRLLVRAADVMIRVFGRNNVFRMGGDEFVILLRSATEDQVDDQMRMLREMFEQNSVSVALGCVWRTKEFANIDELLKEADRRMYVNKKRMHENRA